jgi:hypothetical protein
MPPGFKWVAERVVCSRGNQTCKNTIFSIEGVEGLWALPWRQAAAEWADHTFPGPWEAFQVEVRETVVVSFVMV